MKKVQEYINRTPVEIAPFRTTGISDVLIVDSDPHDREDLRSDFGARGMGVFDAASIREADMLLTQRRFKCILVNQKLPDGDGVGFLIELRRMGVDAKLLLMDDGHDSAVAARAINEGRVLGYFRRPCDSVELLKGVQRACFEYDIDRSRRIYAREITARNELLQYHAEAQKLLGDEVKGVARQASASESSAGLPGEQAYVEIQKAYLQTITSLTRAIEAKDRYTHGHSERVHYYSSITAGILNLPETSRNDLRFASILHDIGKIGIPDSILLKKGPLTEQELRIVDQHGVISETIISPLPFLSRVGLIVRQHHEHVDGSGYPDGLRGGDILFEARILAVADAYDAMRTDRPYRSAMPSSAARLRLQEAKSTQFCPVCVSAFLKALEARGEYDVDAGYPWSDPWSVGATFNLDPLDLDAG